MSTTIVIIIVLLLLIGARSLLGYRRPIIQTLFNMGLGVAALVVLNFFESITLISMPISLMSLGISAIGGVPGVAFLTIFNGTR